MAVKVKALVVLTCLVAVSVLGSVAVAKTDPEVKQCKHQCKHQERFTERQQEHCVRQCEDYYRQKKEREGERERPGRQGRGGGGWDSEEELREDNIVDDERKQLRECQVKCERVEGSSQQKQSCRSQCQERFGKKEAEPWSREEGGQRRRGMSNPREEMEEEESMEEELSTQEDNPYVFQQEHFSTKVDTEHGRISILPKFTKRSKLLRGIENFRLGFLEANPQTFIVPGHWDADAVLFVVSGRGTLNMIRENKRNTMNVEKGDIVRVPSGTPVYLTNRDENEQIYIAKFFQPVNTPGHFEIYHGAGGQNPESVFNAFSWEVLEAALKTGRDKLERLFEQQQQGPIIKASREQIEALSGGEEEGGRWPFGGGSEEGKHWPFGGETRGSGQSHSFNIFSKRPSESNQYGQLYEVDQDEFKQLKDLDLMVSFANISRGSMTALYYNSRATKLAMVVDGEGHFEMACPHLGSGSHGGRQSQREWQGQRTGRQSQREWQGQSTGRQSQREWQGQSTGRQSQREWQGQSTGQSKYQQVRARLNRGTVFIVPAGHPATVIASRDSNLQVVCFEVNAKNNVKYTLTGKNNIMRHMQREAKELAFNFPGRDVDRIFRNQEEVFFFPGPARQEEVIRRVADA